MNRLIMTMGALAGAGLVAASAQADLTVTAETDAATLGNALTVGGAGGINITNVTLTGHSGPGGASSGVYTAGPNAYGLQDDGIVLSSGNVVDYSSGPNTQPDFSTDWGVAATAGEEALLDQITGGAFDHFDVTTLTIEFDAVDGNNFLAFNVVWGSDEFAEFVDTEFIDAYGMFLNGVNIAQSNGFPVNVDHPDMADVPETELDGVLLNPQGGLPTTFGGFINDTGNTLTFIIADSSDGIYDSTVYIEGLEGIPSPGALALFAGAGLFGRRRRRRA